MFTFKFQRDLDKVANGDQLYDVFPGRRYSVSPIAGGKKTVTVTGEDDVRRHHEVGPDAEWQRCYVMNETGATVDSIHFQAERPAEI